MAREHQPNGSGEIMKDEAISWPCKCLILPGHASFSVNYLMNLPETPDLSLKEHDPA